MSKKTGKEVHQRRKNIKKRKNVLKLINNRKTKKKLQIKRSIKNRNLRKRSRKMRINFSFFLAMRKKLKPMKNQSQSQKKRSLLKNQERRLKKEEENPDILNVKKKVFSRGSRLSTKNGEPKKDQIILTRCQTGPGGT